MNSEWPPLESDPQIFNDYFHKIGVPSNIYFKELLGLEYKEFMSIQGPVRGLILNFQKGKNKPKIPEENIKDPKEISFFMKQGITLDNACGLIAGLHLFGNQADIQYVENSFLKKYFDKSKTQSWEERGKNLEGNIDFKEVHSAYAHQGQSMLNNEPVTAHYVSFVLIDTKIFELDGTKKGPILIKENAIWGDFMDDVTKEIIRRVNDKEISDHLSVLICVDENSQLIDFFAD